MAQVGVIVTLKDGASAGLRTMRGAINGVKSAFGAMGAAMTGINQGLEIGRKAWGALNIVVGENVKKALEFRKANDPVAKWFKQMKQDTDALRAAIGDVFIPILMSLSESFGLVGDGAQQWIDKNRVLLASGILEWTIRIARVLVDGVAKGAWLVVKAWSGWQQIIATTEIAVNAFFEVLLDGVGAALESMASLARMLNQDELAATLDGARQSVAGLGAEFARSGDIAQQELAAMIKNADEQIAAIDAMSDAIDKGLVRALKVGLIAIKNFATGAREQLMPTHDLIKTIADALSSEFTTASSYYDALADKQEQQANFLQHLEETRKKIADEQKERMFGVVEGMTTVTDGMAELFAQQGDDAAASAMKITGIVLQSVLKLISLFTAEAVGAAAAGAMREGGGGFAGIALAIQAAAIAISTITALTSQFLAGGGFVQGGVRNKDSTLIGAMPGEYVMSVGEVQGVRRFFDRMVGGGAGQDAAAVLASPEGPRGQTVQVTQVNNNQIAFPSRNGMRKATREQQRSIKDLRRQGMLAGQAGVF